MAVKRDKATETWAKKSIVGFVKSLLTHLDERYPKQDSSVLAAISNVFDFTAWPEQVSGWLLAPPTAKI